MHLWTGGGSLGLAAMWLRSGQKGRRGSVERTRLQQIATHVGLVKQLDICHGPVHGGAGASKFLVETLVLMQPDSSYGEFLAFAYNGGQVLQHLQWQDE